MAKKYKYDYKFVNVNTEIYHEIRRVAGEMQAKSGKRVTAGQAIGEVLKHRKKGGSNVVELSKI